MRHSVACTHATRSCTALVSWCACLIHPLLVVPKEKSGVGGWALRGKETESKENFRAVCACHNPMFAASGSLNPRQYTISYSSGAKGRQAMLKCAYISADVRRVRQSEEALCSTRKKAKRGEIEKRGILWKCLMDDEATQQLVISRYPDAGDTWKSRRRYEYLRCQDSS